MEPHDIKTEKNIKQRIAHVVPPRALFDRIYARVTQQASVRYTREAVPQPLSYKVISTHIFMKRSSLIGAVSIGVLALVAITGYTMMQNRPATVAVNTPIGNDQASNQPSNGTGAAGVKQTSTASAQNVADAATPDAAIDAAMNSILDSGLSDSNSANAESNDGATLNTDLQNYSDVSNTSYDNVI